MAFLKAAWRFLLGVKDVLVLSFLLLFFGMLYATLSMSTGERPHLSRSGALLLDLKGVVVEQPREQDPFALFGNSSPTREHRLRDIVAALDAARSDNHVKAVVLDLDGFMGGGHVTLARIGKALDSVRASGKPVLAYATAYEDDGYQLAAHASEIWLNPIGGVAIMGPGGSQLYYKGLLDKLGVTAHIYRVGTYKSAVEPFMLSGASPEAKQARQTLANSLWANWKADVTRARPKAKVAAYAADPVGLVRAQAGSLSAAAGKAGLIDHIGDKQAFNDHVATLAGADKAAATGYATVKLKNYIKAHQPSANTGPIGVLTVAGEIVDGEASPGTAGGETIAKLLREALAKHKLKALVVRIDSPGGSVLASEQIRLAISQAKANGLPVVASMGDVAASGGYWIATPADKVLAEPSTITGSIGVFGIVPSFKDSLAKIGITSDGVKTTPLSGEPNILGGLSPEFNAVAQMSVEDMYRRFIGLVAKARQLSPQQVDRIAQGRVWNGSTAKQLKLVDGFGGLDEAIAEAARLAKIDPREAKPFYIEKEPDPFTRFLDNAMANEGDAIMPRDLLARQGWWQSAWTAQALADAQMLTQGAGVRATCLECRTYRAPATAALSASLSGRGAGWLGWLTSLLR